MRKSTYVKALFLGIALFVSMGVFAQSKTVKGVVTGGGEPLIGVSVVVEGDELNGVITGVDGSYSIQANGSAKLNFSYIGYKSVTIPVDGRSTVNVVLETDTVVAEEVVVIGYGVQQKSHLTGSISRVEGDRFIDTPTTDVTTALQGQLPGVTINNNTSEIGVSPQIRVRGIGSISASSSPLIVIDGYPVADGLSMINQSDIKSIEVLKDAASAAIYGSRAANGVILITTKEGAANAPRYTVKAFSGFKYAYQLHSLLNSAEALQLAQWEESVGGPAVTAQIRSAAWLEENMGYTDWQHLALRNPAKTNNIQFNISGGKDQTRYYTSASLSSDQGIMLQNEVQKFNFRTKLNTKLSARAEFGTNVSLTYTYATRPYSNYIDFYRTPSFLPLYHNDWSTALTGYSGYARGSHFLNVQSPTGPVDEMGNPTWDKSSPFSSANNNPRKVMDNTFRSRESFQSVGSFYFQYEILKNLVFKTSNGYNVRYSPSYYYYNKDATKDDIAATAYYGHSLFMDLLTENTLNYSCKKGAHSVDALLGYTLQSTRVDNVDMYATGFATDDIHTLNAATVYDIDKSGTFKYPQRLLSSFLGRVNYNYDERYLVSVSTRLDRSSLFTRGHRNAWFPSVSLGWRASEEEFLKTVWWLSNLKLRGSYGVTGNNDIDYNATQNMMSQANYILGTGNGSLASGSAITKATLANPLVTWEQTDEYNAGLDISLFDNRISLSVDAYYSTTRALLLEQPTQSFTGFKYNWNNIGKVRNKGLEVLLETRNINNRNFTWDTSFNLSMNRNRLLEYGGEKQAISKGERNESYIAIVGGPLIQYYGYKTIGVWNSAEEIAANPHNSSDVPGGLRVEDYSNDGQITPDDFQVLGDPYPDFTWGMTNTFKMGDFDLSFLLQGVQGITVFNGDVYYNETHKWNKAYIKDRWVSETHPGSGMIPYQKKGIDLLLTDYPLQDGSYFCLRNVTFGYTLPKKAAKNLGLRGLRVYASGNNLFYWWSKGYKGINPEARYTSSNYSSPLISGYQRGGFPLTSTVTVGVDVNF